LFIVRKRRLPFVLLILIAVLLIVVGLVRTAPGPVMELDLNQSELGLAFELFRDQNGHLWISEFGADEIWHVDPDIGNYTIYGNLTGASDAKVDGNGDLWWNNYTNNELGRYTPGQNSADTWSLTGAVSQTLGLAIDSDGNIWSSDVYAAILHRYQPAIEEMCTYAVPDNGASSFIVADSGRIWLGDYINNRILALDPDEKEFEIWHLPNSDGANIYGLAVDENHDIWWADQNQNFLGRLTPQHNQVTTYTLPGQLGFGPTIVSTGQSKVWTTSRSLDFIARLDPEKIYLQPTSVITTTTRATRVCDDSVNAKNLHVTVDGPFEFDWSGAFYNRPTDPDSDIWLFYQMRKADEDPPIGMAWGIVDTGEDIYIVDQGRQKLTRLQACFQLTLTHSGYGEDPLDSLDPFRICPEGEHRAGEKVTLTARPAVGFGIVRWRNSDDDSSKELTNSVTMPSEKYTVFVDYGASTFLPVISRD